MLLFLLACTGTKPDTGTPAESTPDVESDPVTHESQDSPTESRPDSPTGDSDPDSPTGDSDPPPSSSKTVILFIGDGMGPIHIEGGGLYANGAMGSLVMETLPYQGHLRTASYSGVTDSAAAATAISTGYKTNNAMIGLDREGNTVTSVRELAESLGMVTGVVTTDALTGATPSAFTVHVEDRGDADTIAAQLIADPPDLAFGGGYMPIYDLAIAAGYAVATTRDELMAAPDDDQPLFGLFADSTFPYLADGYTTEPSLAEMTSVAIDRLSDDPEGFFLMVEGARIDHASHANNTNAVHLETAAFDAAIATAMAWAEGRDDVTIIVTADHECGGIGVEDGSSAGTIPTTTWTSRGHTNADVRVLGMGEKASYFHEQRLDNTAVWAVISATLTDSEITLPDPGLLADGWTEEISGPITTQVWDSSFGMGYNQLDDLRVNTDSYGVYVGINGVYEWASNTVLLLVDLDYGDSTGLGADVSDLTDSIGSLDIAISSFQLTSAVEGFGADVVLGSVGGAFVGLQDFPSETVGLRGLHGDWGTSENLYWLGSILVHDDGNVARDGAAPDAGATGTTLGGMEAVLPWESVFPDGLPADGTAIALAAVLVNTDGTWISNQVLPPLAEDQAPEDGALELSAVVALEVGADGVLVTSPTVVP